MEKQFFPYMAGNNTNLIIAIVAIVIILWILYMIVITRKNNVREAFSSIDVQLKKRYDLIPNILFIANKFMEHERGLLTDITQLRTQATQLPQGFENAAQKMELDGKISGLMGKLMVAVENYPQLKSDQTMIQAMQTYSEQEEHIAAARRFYNSAAKDLNNVVEIFPTSVIALMLGIKQAPFFEANEVERERIDASQYFTQH